MKLGLLGHGFIEWGGGMDFLRGVCGSLHAADETLELHLLLPTSGPRLLAQRSLQSIKHLTRRSLGRPSVLPKTTPATILQDFATSFGVPVHTHAIDSGSRAIARAVSRLGLRAVLPSVQPLKLPDVPWVGYIADFQHAHLPQYFSAEEIAARNCNFDAMLHSAPLVMVNARAVAQDIATLLPGRPAQVLAMPFSAAPNPEWLKPNPPPLARYGLKHPYFIISNQFWQHKDHATAFRALALVRQEHPQVELVCTGEPHDFRNPDHMAHLQSLAKQLGIEGALHILGLIPKLDQIALLRASLAAIQTTHFEGGPGGGSVFDAVALGQPAIVSDIAVNREIDEPCVTFFQCGSADDLACAMLQRIHAGPASQLSAHALLEAGKARRAACGQALLAALDRLPSRSR